MEFLSRYNIGNAEYQFRDPIGCKTWYGVCSTDSVTADKVATTINGDFELKQGSCCRILFSNSQEATGTVTINIDNTGAKEVQYISTPTYLWEAGQIAELIYNGTYFSVLAKTL